MNISQQNPRHILLVKSLAVVIIFLALVLIIIRLDGLSINAITASGSTNDDPTVPIGIYGVITRLTPTSLTLDDSHGSDYKNMPTYTVDFSHVQTIETSDNGLLTINDIAVGDTIIAHGLLKGTKLTADEIISFSAASHASTTSSLSQ